MKNLKLDIIKRFLSGKELQDFLKSYQANLYRKTFVPTDLERRVYAAYLDDELNQGSAMDKLGIKSPTTFYAFLGKMMSSTKKGAK